MNNLELFENPEFGQIRTILIKDKPYFVASDVAKALGYSKPNNAINQHCKGATLKQGIIDNLGREQDTLVIPEGDIYRLVIKSKLPTAQKFEVWVFDEVLPTVRKHGAYMTPQTIEEALLNPDTIIQLATRLKEEREKNIRLETHNKQQEQIIGELKPKADYTDRILQSKSLVNANQIAKDYGMSAQTFNKVLYRLGIQYKQNEQWLLYSKHQGKGYTSSSTFKFERADGTTSVAMRTMWTQKGRLFIYETLKANDILPLIEQIAS